MLGFPGTAPAYPAYAPPPDSAAPVRFALAVTLARDGEPDEQVRQHNQHRDADEDDAGALPRIAAEEQQHHAGDRDQSRQDDADDDHERTLSIPTRRRPDTT